MAAFGKVLPEREELRKGLTSLNAKIIGRELSPQSVYVTQCPYPKWPRRIKMEKKDPPTGQIQGSEKKELRSGPCKEQNQGLIKEYSPFSG